MEPYNTINIKDMIKTINNYLTNLISQGDTDPFKNELKIIEVFPEFYDMYPFLIKKLCKQEDINMIYHMLDKLDDINKGKSTLNTVEHELGQELYNKYLDPNIPK